MRTPFSDPSEPQPGNRRERRAGKPGAVQPRFGGGRVVVNPRQYAMRRR
ncbi:hypothetical protein [Saccharothrix coeruleofusca]|uniref:Uncharacterized protein n=1 Tax=Saccharothrix coeruleofusca TaxID=33919 RepID=A0A918AHH9_9PSEU|nr:hypothetical protein [Saccharothrix coeruleofusca]MBP2334479.1 hypothetical protein [Saccharothrix coeruleofusca]GGP40743.1 hypothetical protein GCM10010185_09780 [Saccharothrix coeruleofusca]